MPVPADNKSAAAEIIVTVMASTLESLLRRVVWLFADRKGGSGSGSGTHSSNSSSSSGGGGGTTTAWRLGLLVAIAMPSIALGLFFFRRQAGRGIRTINVQALHGAVTAADLSRALTDAYARALKAKALQPLVTSTAQVVKDGGVPVRLRAAPLKRCVLPKTAWHDSNSTWL